jgi:hypothetical protein
MRFVDGLKDDIKAVVLVQRLVELDTGCVLALLQEEANLSRCLEYRKSEFLFKPKPGGGAVPWGRRNAVATPSFASQA